MQRGCAGGAGMHNTNLSSDWGFNKKIGRIWTHFWQISGIFRKKNIFGSSGLLITITKRSNMFLRPPGRRLIFSKCGYTRLVLFFWTFSDLFVNQPLEKKRIISGKKVYCSLGDRKTRLSRLLLKMSILWTVSNDFNNCMLPVLTLCFKYRVLFSRVSSSFR